MTSSSVPGTRAASARAPGAVRSLALPGSTSGALARAFSARRHTAAPVPAGGSSARPRVSATARVDLREQKQNHLIVFLHAPLAALAAPPLRRTWRLAVRPGIARVIWPRMLSRSAGSALTHHCPRPRRAVESTLADGGKESASGRPPALHPWPANHVRCRKGSHRGPGPRFFTILFLKYTPVSFGQ